MKISNLTSWDIYDDDYMHKDAAIEYYTAALEQHGRVLTLEKEVEYLKKLLELKNIPAVFTEKDKQDIVNAVVTEVKSISEVLKKAAGNIPNLSNLFNFKKE